MSLGPLGHHGRLQHTLIWQTIGRGLIHCLALSAIFFLHFLPITEHSLFDSSKIYFVCHSPWRKFCIQDLASLTLFMKIPQKMFAYEIVYPFGLVMLAFFMAHQRFIIISILIHFRKVFLRTKKTETRRDRFIHKTFFLLSTHAPFSFNSKFLFNLNFSLTMHNAPKTNKKQKQNYTESVRVTDKKKIDVVKEV